MPKIFSDEKKKLLYEALKQNCLHLIKVHGYKGLNIRELTKVSGISAGTFYHFYSSKEDLILAILEDSQRNLTNRFLELCRLNGHVNRSEFINLYYTFFVEDKTNILRYLSRDDITAILFRSNKNGSNETVKNFMIKNIKHLDRPKQNINLNAVINFTQLINLCIQNSDLLIKEEQTNTIKTLLENIADEIFLEEC